MADDFFLLVNDYKLPLTESIDQLHRPLRNVVLKSLGAAVGVQQVLPYRLLGGASFGAVLLLFFRLLRRLGAGRLASLAATFLLAFFPRNQEVLFWFAAWQDLIAAAAVLAVCVCFLSYRQSNRASYLALATICYGVALGFKETTVFLPVVLVALDSFRGRQIPRFSDRTVWKAYLPLGCVLAIYGVYFLADAGLASLAGHRTGGYYAFPGFRYLISGLLRSLANIAIPFSAPFTLTDLRVLPALLITGEFGLLVLLTAWLRRWSAFLPAVTWFFCLVLPTAVFAAAMNADRYLLVPVMGFFLLIAFLADGLLARRHRAGYAVVIVSAVAAYTIFDVLWLVEAREQWRSSGVEAAVIIRESMDLSKHLQEGSEVYFVNITHSQRFQRPVFANGLSEALHGYGFPFSARIERNFTDSDPRQRELLAGLVKCETPDEDLPASRAVLVEVGRHMHRINASCAYQLIERDRRERPQAWARLFPIPTAQ